MLVSYNGLWKLLIDKNMKKLIWSMNSGLAVVLLQR